MKTQTGRLIINANPSVRLTDTHVSAIKIINISSASNDSYAYQEFIYNNQIEKKCIAS